MENKTPLVYLEKYGGRMDKEIIKIMKKAGYDVWVENYGHWLWKLKTPQKKYKK